jgi:hypothetical protein
MHPESESAFIVSCPQSNLAVREIEYRRFDMAVSRQRNPPTGSRDSTSLEELIERRLKHLDEW